MTKAALIIGGGVAGCSCAYFLNSKGWETTIVEAEDSLGGLSKTKYYRGHPYEFGPHVWFWPENDLNDILLGLTEVYEVDRVLYSFGNDAEVSRYPLNMEDIQRRVDYEDIKAELQAHRDENLNIIPGTMPKIGECTFEEYFKAAVGPTLYHDYMETYTRKMWGIPGNELTTKMVWADRIRTHNSDEPYDPIKRGAESLGTGMKNLYPKNGWNPVWNKMAAGSRVLLNTRLVVTTGRNLYFDTHLGKLIVNTDKIDAVIWTLHVDEVTTRTLPANGRLVVPFLFPKERMPSMGTESLHMADECPVTRITYMDHITRYEGPNRLVTMELPGAAAKSGFEFTNQWYHPRCYNHQTDDAVEQNKQQQENLKREIPNIHFCGRHAEFAYYGMPQVVASAKKLCEVL